MKRSIPLFALFICSYCISAQITVTNATFPAIGDTLKTITDLSPEGIEITNAGGPFDWDFTSLGSGPQSVDVFLDASLGSAFDQAPGATHYLTNNIDQAESYFKVSNDKVEFIGVSGNDPTGFGINAFLRFDPPVVQRRAPMNFIDNNTSQSDVRVAIAWDDLPPVLTDSLGFPLVDSIALVIGSSRNDLVDAYGTLSIPGGTYEVLREKRVEMRETRVEILTFLGWLDVTDQLPAGFGNFGNETITSYLFFSDTEKEVIAAVTVDSMGTPETVTFKNNGVVSNTKELKYQNASVNLMPNPVEQTTTFEFFNIPMGTYHLSVANLHGSTLYDNPVRIFGNQTELIDLSYLSVGVHFFTLKDRQGVIVSSGKLLKL